MLSDFLGAVTLGLRSYKGYLAKPSVITQYGYSVPDNNNSKKKPCYPESLTTEHFSYPLHI